MKRRVFPRVLVFFLATLVVGCEGERGPTGPQGPTGPPGDDGVDGTGLVAYYQWSTRDSTTVPSNDYTIALEGYAPKEPAQVGIFCAYIATISASDFIGWEELPLLVLDPGGEPVWVGVTFDWETGEANFRECEGAYVYCQVFVFELPSGPAGR
jgi:hypothetical protein